MAATKLDEPPPPPDDYCALPSHRDENDAVLFHHVSSRQRRIIYTIFLISLSAILAYIFWPSDPRFEIVRLRVTRVHVHRKPFISIDMSLLVRLKVSNADVYSLGYKTLDVAIGYRGKVLGHVRSEDGRVRALGSSYVDAETELDGVGVFSDVVHLLRDLAKGSVQFGTVTEVNGKLGLLFFRFPLKAKLSCEILVDTINETIARQNCYPVLVEKQVL